LYSRVFYQFIIYIFTLILQINTFFHFPPCLVWLLGDHNKFYSAEVTYGHRGFIT